MPDDFPADWLPPRQFHAAHRNLHTSMESLRWELRFRHQNGLILDGVVIERRADPDASRPALLISPTRYIARLKRLSRVG